MRHLVAHRRRVLASLDSSAHRVQTGHRPPTVSRETFVPRESSAHQAPVKVGHVNVCSLIHPYLSVCNLLFYLINL